MANLLPQGIPDFKAAVQWFLTQQDYVSPKVKVLVELYQATSDHYPNAEEYQGDANVTGGVCQGMALEWIKKNSLAGGDKTFRELAQSNWDTFANAQLSIHHNKRCLKITQAGLDERSIQCEAERLRLKSDISYARETGLFASAKHFFSPPTSNSQRELEIDALKKSLTALDVEQRELADLKDTMYSSKVFTDGNSAGKFEKLAAEPGLSDVANTLRLDPGNQPCYYMLNLTKGGSDSGHTVAVNASYRPRLLDANSCEFQFDSMTTMESFIDDYWQIYNRVGYGGVKVLIYVFKVRLVKRPLAMGMIERANRAEVMKELVGRVAQI